MYICIYYRILSESLVWPTSVPQALFFLEKTTFPDFLTMSILGTVRIVRISISMDLGTCLKRRAPKNHEFWRYSDLQISHSEPFGEQNDELNFGHQTRIPLSGVANILIFQDTIKKIVSGRPN